MDLLEFLDVFVVLLKVLCLELVFVRIVVHVGQSQACLARCCHDSVELPHEGTQFVAVPFQKVDNLIGLGLRPEPMYLQLSREMFVEVVGELGHIRQYLESIVRHHWELLCLQQDRLVSILTLIALGVRVLYLWGFHFVEFVLYFGCVQDRQQGSCLRVLDVPIYF